MQAGRELDALIVTTIMGWTRTPNTRRNQSDDMDYDWHWIPSQFHNNVAYSRPLPRYSTDITAAMQALERVVERLGEDYFWHIAKLRHGQYSAYIGWERASTPVVVGRAASTAIAHAACLAALKAVGEEAPTHG